MGAPDVIASKIIGLALIALMGVTILYLWERNQNLQDDLAVRDAIIESHKESQRIHKRYVEETAVIRTENDDLRRELTEMEGGNAPLSDYLSSVSSRVYGK